MVLVVVWRLVFRGILAGNEQELVLELLAVVTEVIGIVFGKLVRDGSTNGVIASFCKFLGLVNQALDRPFATTCS